jgi:hypothetical protein
MIVTKNFNEHIPSFKNASLKVYIYIYKIGIILYDNLFHPVI